MVATEPLEDQVALQSVARPLLGAQVGPEEVVEGGAVEVVPGAPGLQRQDLALAEMKALPIRELWQRDLGVGACPLEGRNMPVRLRASEEVLVPNWGSKPERTWRHPVPDCGGQVAPAIVTARGRCCPGRGPVTTQPGS
jgi:hypothetical protein